MYRDKKDMKALSSMGETTTNNKSNNAEAYNVNQDNAISDDNWSSIYDSKVLAKTKEGMLCGNVVAEYNDNIVLIDFAASNLQEYLVPKSTIERYDGKYLYLTIPHDVLTSYGY
ncbi:MAG: hypothetical protein WBP64_07035 [Nitrososphaeraceae archaeon]|jgi:hypothetical protein